MLELITEISSFFIRTGLFIHVFHVEEDHFCNIGVAIKHFHPCLMFSGRARSTLIARGTQIYLPLFYDTAQR